MTKGTTLEPLDDKIIIRPQEAADKTQGGILIPDQAKEKPLKGEVLAVGPGRRNDKGERIPMDVQAGDIVLFSRYAGQDYGEDNDKIKIIQLSDVLAKEVK